MFELRYFDVSVFVELLLFKSFSTQTFRAIFKVFSSIVTQSLTA